MSRSADALVDPTLLVWARKSSGLTIEAAAERLRISEVQLKSWETGTKHLTINQLRKLGELYKRPIAVFYLSAPPESFPAMRDYRKLPNSVPKDTPELEFEIRKAHSRREIASELFHELEGTEATKPDISISLAEDPEISASTIRTWLDVSLTQQRKWAPGYDSLNGWRAAVESKNILVFQASKIPLEEMRGFSITQLPFPAIVINVKDSVNGRLFTLLHELVHIGLGEEGICDLHSDPARKNIEVFCNHVAGAALVPQVALLSEPELKAGKQLDLVDIAAIAGRYRVSRDVVLRRLLTLKKLSERDFEKYHTVLKKQIEELEQTTSGPVPVYRKVISSLGPLFSKLVLSSYYQDKITASDVSEYLSVRLKHLPAIEQSLWGRTT